MELFFLEQAFVVYWFDGEGGRRHSFTCESICILGGWGFGLEVRCLKLLLLEPPLGKSYHNMRMYTRT